MANRPCMIRPPFLFRPDLLYSLQASFISHMVFLGVLHTQRILLTQSFYSYYSLCGEHCSLNTYVFPSVTSFRPLLKCLSQRGFLWLPYSKLSLPKLSIPHPDQFFLIIFFSHLTCCMFHLLIYWLSSCLECKYNEGMGFAHCFIFRTVTNIWHIVGTQVTLVYLSVRQLWVQTKPAPLLSRCRNKNIENIRNTPVLSTRNIGVPFFSIRT